MIPNSFIILFILNNTHTPCILNYKSNSYSSQRIFFTTLVRPNYMFWLQTHQDPERIQKLRMLHHKTCKLSATINNIFSMRNLLLVLHHCTLFTVYLYWAIRHSLPGVKIQFHAVLNMYRAAIMSIVSIMWLIWPSNVTINEASSHQTWRDQVSIVIPIYWMVSNTFSGKENQTFSARSDWSHSQPSVSWAAWTIFYTVDSWTS